MAEALVAPAPVAPVAPPISTATKPTNENELMAPSAASLLALAEPGKKIRRIVIFYHDGTFADYQPE
ncbi:hypothetical protein [Hymenobacter cellulosivorans]|uniref:Uncharacterized protein n=1 Tax=Hymenobacter cellulosivorans TaxID=2932249 RepID=A0ABY4F6T6_9BACT|nr:hypothetical protein [Hymenobacter cellulosivorans]UOQ51931.1 hypothetical protein MUN80_19475 [Hymenobacter cellulosivorans]